jgi:hypothetical protein
MRNKERKTKMTYFKDTFSDGSPDFTSPHKPGYRFADTDDASRHAASEAYEAKRTRMSDAWRKNNDATLDGAQARATANAAYAEKIARLSNAWKKQ